MIFIFVVFVWTFNDTFKYRFNFKVNVKFKVKYEKSAYFITFFSYCLKVNLNGKKFFKAKYTRMYRL